MIQINYDKVKHTGGVIALALIVPAAAWPHGKWIALGLGLVAFLLGAQSEQLFTRQVADTTGKAP